MMDEFLTLVKQMVEDDKLTIQEFATLDRWLAERPDVAAEWPASLVAEGIRQICADNVVDQQELEAMCGALKRIVKEDT